MNSKEFINLCKDNDINDVQIMYTEDYTSLLEIENDEIKKDQTLNIISYLIKAKYLDNTVSLKCEKLDDSLINQIKEMATYTEKKNDEEFALSLIAPNNTTIVKSSINKYKKEILDINARELNKHGELKSLLHQISFTSLLKRIINSNGLDVSSSSSYYQYTIEITANNGKENACEWFIKTVKDENELDIEKITVETIEKNLSHLEEKNLKNGTYKALFTSNVVTDIISYLLTMLTGDNINKHMSMLEGHLNEKMYSSKLTIVEDATDINAPLFRAFDDEGTKTKRNVLIENGVLKSYMHNKRSAQEANTTSTGNGYNDSIGYRNIVVKSGTKSYDEIVKSIDYGILVTEIMITQAARNACTGTYNGSMFGFLIENGRIKHALQNVMFSTSIADLLNNIIEIGKEAEYTNPNIKTPSILVDNIAFTGEGKNEN